MIRLRLRRILYLVPVVLFGFYLMIFSQPDIEDHGKVGKVGKVQEFVKIVREENKASEEDDEGFLEPQLKILVLAYNRAKSLAQCLSSLQNLKLDGSKGVVEIWIDRSENDTIDAEVLETAQNFCWKNGPSSVHVQEHHVGIYGQWINTWQPHEQSEEIAIILEDDIDLSPFAFRWLKQAHSHYDGRPDIAGYGLSDIEIPLADPHDLLKTSPDEIAFMFSRFSTFGFSPKLSVWKKFQAWYAQKAKSKSFKPYTKSDSLFTRWFRIFERKNSQKSMWSIWFIRFCVEEKLNTLYANTFRYLTKHYPEVGSQTSLAYHRREGGLHFSQVQSRTSDDYLMNIWFPELVQFPPEVTKYTIPPPKKTAKVVRRVVSKNKDPQQS